MNQPTNRQTNEPTSTVEAVPVLYCTYHPNRETVLRCNRCGQPICFDCAVRTPVGYRCRQCVRNQQAAYYNAGSADPAISVIVALILGAVVGVAAFLLLGGFGFFSFLIAFFAGPAAGGLIAEAVRQAVQRRRFRQMRWLVALAAIAGIFLGGLLLAGFGGGRMAPALLRLPLLFARIDVLLFAVLAGSAIYARFQ